MMKRSLIVATFLISLSFVFILPQITWADGDEILGDPSIPIASGSNLLASGTGLVTQPATITLGVPMGATVKQVLLYWQGRGIPDDTIIVEGNEITGVLIGETSVLSSNSYSYRSDITSLALIAPGSNTLSVSGLNFSVKNDGAAVFVIIDDGMGVASIDIRDGMDFAYIYSLTPADVTEAQTFDFPVSNDDRTASLFLLLGDGTSDRPDEIEISVDGITTVLYNEAKGRDGAEWDTIILPVNIPAGITSFTVELFSRDTIAMGGIPDSLSWIVASLVIQEIPQASCRVTAGGNRDNGGMDTWGGQAGAQPGIDGNWTHHHKPGPRESFVFHSNDLFDIRCSDPGDFCEPARFAPFRQIDFSGIGRFNNQKGFSFPTEPVCFTVHLEDTGEPGPGSRKRDVDPTLCDHCPGTPIINAVDCENCTDYYEIKIYDNADCTGEPIYVNGPGVPENCQELGDPNLFGYFTDQGNVQMHPENN